MNEFCLKIFNIASQYGSYRKPFLNRVIFYNKINNGWNSLFKSFLFS
ncbi:hypothetical protein OSSY52_02110 [Tepiditoga spiralis]|uniref:Uncharacterized protein n=1 Tax=Tepiditoga spiralis TaxID=2108365 RepID=A0A7G1G1K2_9BACT|nr:hypothetical protein [Tepiditoga spiralis]BBE30070.1 hypothetical protein OSSY52_02110 [Tepiditoga spiralis]